MTEASQTRPSPVCRVVAATWKATTGLALTVDNVQFLEAGCSFSQLRLVWLEESNAKISGVLGRILQSEQLSGHTRTST